MIIVYGVVLFFGVDWRIALVIILTSIFAILIPRMIGKSLTDARSTYQEQMAEYVTEITDLLEGFRVINQMTVGKILDKHEHVLNETAEKRYQYGKKKSMVLGVSELTTKFVKIFTFAVVAVLFYKHEITVGVGVATLSYVSSFIEPIDTVLYNFHGNTVHEGREEKSISLYAGYACHSPATKEKIKFRYNIRKCDIQKEKFCIGKYKFNNKKRHEVCCCRTQRSRKINLVQTYYGV